MLNNSRFYILVTSILLSMAVVGFLRITIVSDQLFYIRTQQVFGLLGVMYWYVAMIISPIGYIIGKQHMKKWEFARRAIGVSAFYFVLLHGVIALWGQLGGLTELQYLPTMFKWSLAGGAVAFSILLIMALTSFDVVVKFMTYRKWKWLHRLVYVGGVLALIHIWTVGTHLAYSQVQVAAFVALLVLAGLELYRSVGKANDAYLHLNKSEAITLFISSWAVVAVLLLATPTLIKNYHSRHTDHSESMSEDHS